MKFRAACAFVLLVAGIAVAQSTLVPNPTVPSVEYGEADADHSRRNQDSALAETSNFDQNGEGRRSSLRRDLPFPSWSTTGS